MTKRKQRRVKAIADDVIKYGADVIDSEGHKSCAKYIQHGDTSVQDHTISVACVCLKIAKILHLKKFDRYDLVRGALLHDYFLYDWHIYDPERGHGHGFKHASIAAKRAAEDFSVTPLMAEMIKKHMWPLNLALPLHREAYILILADKVCSLRETFGKPYYYMVLDEIKGEA